ncbi:biotin/lipoyl-containing protein [Micromonospora sp. BRA006-A]|nr:biotin/lipoyl-containing protein [Micromonospora sp. BRA006-A]
MGSEVAARLHAEAWPLLRGPVELVSSADRVIPSAPHLEQAVLLGTDAILDRIMRLPGAVPVPRTDSSPAGPPPPAPTTAAQAGVPVDVPRLNPNDDSYVLLEWLVADGATVEAGEPVAAVETSKAIEELAATQAGVLRQDVAAGADCARARPSAGSCPGRPCPRRWIRRARPLRRTRRRWRPWGRGRRRRDGRCHRRSAASPTWCPPRTGRSRWPSPPSAST